MTEDENKRCYKSKFIKYFQFFHANSLRMEDVTKNVQTTAQKLCVLACQRTTNLEQMENLVKRFTHATNQITVDALINVLKTKKTLNVVVMKDVK